MSYPLRISTTVAVFLAIIAAGSLVTALTVHDLVPVDPRARACVEAGRLLNLDNPLERLAVQLGKVRIIKADISSAEFEAYTIFRIPLGVLRGVPDMKFGVSCSLIGP
jgi:hypothetical protein